MNKTAQKRFIHDYLYTHGCTDVCNSGFHDGFYRRFGGKRKEPFYGARPVYKAQRLLAEMTRAGVLARYRRSLVEMPQGFPKWVYVYELA
jgi:hypothetical protein